MKVIPSSPLPLDLHTIRSQARELENMLGDLEEDVSELSPSDSQKLLNNCTLYFQSRMEEIGSEWSDVGFSIDKNFDECLKHLGEELNSVEAESTKISQEIENLKRTHAEEVEKVKLTSCDDDIRHGEDHSNSTNVFGSKKIELLELENQIKEKNIILKSLEDLDCTCKWFDAIEQIEDIFSGVKVIAFDENYIRLSLRTYIPKLERILSQQKIEANNAPMELKHELMIEVLEGTMDQKNVEWFVTKVRDRIVSCTRRQLVVKSANKSRYSLEYLDKDEMILAHLAGGVDVLIKVSQGWPQSSSPLKLISLKGSDNDMKGMSLSFLCKVKEAVNSLAIHVRQNLSGFVDAVEKILIEQMQLELESDKNPKE